MDDTDTIHTGQNIDTPGNKIIEKFQEVMNRWEGGLRATGGALVPSKSFWYLIDFHWLGSEWRYKTINEVPGSIQVRSTDGTSTEVLQQYEPSHSEVILGVYLSMDGNKKAQKAHLRGKAIEFGNYLRKNSASRNDAWYTLNQSFMKTIEYPLIVTTLSVKDWGYIMAPALKQVLPKSGFSSPFCQPCYMDQLNIKDLDSCTPGGIKG